MVTTWTLMVLALPASAAALPPAPAGVQVSHEQGIEFVTVGDPGNAGIPWSTVPWTGIGNDRIGRGSVPYDYRIARSEVTSGQWVEFLNTFAPRQIPEALKPRLAPYGLSEFYIGPFSFGAGIVESDPVARTARYELRTDTPDASNIPVWGLSWRMSALYCNWLHNGKSSEWEALLGGAYDTTTWGNEPGTNSYTDKITHEAGAKFWIPTLDEWGKAAHYDPNRNGPGEGGWWFRHYGMDEPPTPGFPGDPGAQSSAGIPVFDYSSAAMDIPLASYSAMSPWGLFDTAGGTMEIVGEYPNLLNPLHYRVLALGPTAGSGTLDPKFINEALAVNTRPFTGGSASFFMGNHLSGLRVAAAVPSPSAVVLLLPFGALMVSRRRSVAPITR